MKKTTLCNCKSCRGGKCGICRDALYGVTDGMAVLDHGLIRSEQDIMKLNIIDWTRYDPWPDPQAAMHTIFSWFKEMAHYTILKEDMEKCPDRDDFPGWHHVGNHEADGKTYWNWFQHWHGAHGELHFSDSPDFYGQFNYRNEKQSFWGDIGQCSAQALARTQKQMSANDLWISIPSTSVQVVIETTVNLIDLFGELLEEKNQDTLPEKPLVEAPEHIQLSLFN